MTSSAERAVAGVMLLAIGAGFAAASTPAPQVGVDACTPRVIEALSGEWGLPAAALHLSWSGTPPAAGPSPDAAFHVFGRGHDGWVVIQFETPGAPDLALRARVAVDESVPVATRALLPGSVLAPEDVRLESRPHWGPRETAEETAKPGWIVRRALAAGEIVRGPAVEPPCVVHDGESVKWSWENGDVRVTARAVALGSAALGGRVSVRLADGTVHRDGVAAGVGVVVARTGGGR